MRNLVHIFFFLLATSLCSQDDDYLVSYQQATQSNGIPQLKLSSWSFDDNTPSSKDVARPSGTVNTEIMFVIVSTDIVNVSTPEFDINSDPSGWEFVTTLGNSDSDAHLGLFWRAVDGTEGSGPYTFSPATAADMAIACIRISGANTLNPIGTIGAAYTASSDTSHALTGITTAHDNSIALYIFGFDGSDGAPFSISGTAWEEYQEFDNPTNDGDNTEIVVGKKDMATAGATGDATIGTSIADGGVGLIIEIRSE